MIFDLEVILTMYIQRILEPKLEELSGHFPVVMICGARQVGKTTLLRQFIAGHDEINYVTLDYPMLRSLARTDPELFLQQYEAPLVIDEIQYAPELLPYIKIRADRYGQNGMYFLTGSQMFHMMKNVSESLAGRVGILSMYSFSRAETEGRTSEAFLPSRHTKFPLAGQDTVSDIFQKIYRGGMPRMAVDPELTPEDYFGGYVQTYLERDIRDLNAVRDETRFMRFISCAAARTSQEVNLADLAKDVGIDSKTADGWLSILVSSGIVYLLQPYSGNTIKRIVKRPKLYFMDTGLACYLSMWNDPRTLELSAMSGAFFETWVVSEIIKSYVNQGLEVRGRLFYYRDNNGKEIDLLILQNGVLYPIEIKKSADPGRDVLKNFRVLEALPEKTGEGAVICMTPMIVPLDRMNLLVPVGCI